MPSLSPSTPYETGSVKLVDLGAAYRQDSTGRSWHYAEAGGSDLDPGKLAVAATVDAQRINLSFASAPAVGDKVVSITIGTGNAAADDFEDGWLVVQDGTGEPNLYPIEGHNAITASTAGNIYLKEAIRTAGATAQTGCDLLKNRYKDIVISVTDHADPLAGVPNVTIPDTEYGWVQTWGACAVWADEAVAAGAALTSGDTTAGQVEIQTAGDPLVGHAGMTALVEDEYKLVHLAIDY
jgi:hypothetical protein